MVGLKNVALEEQRAEKGGMESEEKQKARLARVGLGGNGKRRLSAAARNFSA
jgi:hypothetical protein